MNAGGSYGGALCLIEHVFVEGPWPRKTLTIDVVHRLCLNSSGDLDRELETAVASVEDAPPAPPLVAVPQVTALT